MKLAEWFCLTAIYNLLIPCFGVSSYQTMPCHSIHYLPWWGIPPFLWNTKVSLTANNCGPTLTLLYLVNLSWSMQDKTDHLTGTAVWFLKSPRNSTSVEWFIWFVTKCWQVSSGLTLLLCGPFSTAACNCEGTDWSLCTRHQKWGKVSEKKKPL